MEYNEIRRQYVEGSMSLDEGTEYLDGLSWDGKCYEVPLLGVELALLDAREADALRKETADLRAQVRQLTKDSPDTLALKVLHGQLETLQSYIGHALELIEPFADRFPPVPTPRVLKDFSLLCWNIRTRAEELLAPAVESWNTIQLPFAEPGAPPTLGDCL